MRKKPWTFGLALLGLALELVAIKPATSAPLARNDRKNVAPPLPATARAKTAKGRGRTADIQRSMTTGYWQ
jgi:hypothetical protein